jgi:predicted nuclease of predicted toxin-antitoxin system
VVQIRAGDLNLNAIGAVIIAALRQMDAELAAGALVTIDTNRTRLRLLPLQLEG